MSQVSHHFLLKSSVNLQRSEVKWKVVATSVFPILKAFSLVPWWTRAANRHLHGICPSSKRYELHSVKKQGPQQVRLQHLHKRRLRPKSAEERRRLKSRLLLRQPRIKGLVGHLTGLPEDKGYLWRLRLKEHSGLIPIKVSRRRESHWIWLKQHQRPALWFR